MQMAGGRRSLRRLKKLIWHFHKPAWARQHGILLPAWQPGIPPGVARQIWLGEYEDKEFDIVSRRLTSDDVVFEVGTGLGFLAAYCARVVGSGRVFTYEANPGLIPVLKEVFDRNGVHPHLSNALLGNGNGTREFHLAKDFWSSSAHRQGPRQITVQQLDLNTELRRLRPTFLIVDIEGGECELLAEADLSSVRKICVETHPDVLDNASLSRMLAGLIAKGFALDFTLMRKNVLFLHRFS